MAHVAEDSLEELGREGLEEGRGDRLEELGAVLRNVPGGEGELEGAEGLGGAVGGAHRGEGKLLRAEANGTRSGLDLRRRCYLMVCWTVRANAALEGKKRRRCLEKRFRMVLARTALFTWVGSPQLGEVELRH